jgi:hypothetical protein
MTTRITIKNEGPDLLEIWFYKKDRTFSDEKVTLQVGESHETNIWDDHLPVCMPRGHTEMRSELKDGTTRFYAVPPATY